MPTLSGTSHTVSGVFGVVLASYVSLYVERYAPAIYAGSDAVGRAALASVPGHPPILEELAGAFVVMLVVWFLWGWFYHVVRFHL